MLFAILETSKVSTGFSTFELLFGSRPCGLLDMAKEAWEEQLFPFQSVVGYVQDMQQHIKLVALIIKEYMKAAQREQQWAYNHPA